MSGGGELAQSLTPGLLGMAVHTDCAYLQAVQREAGTLRGSSLSSLELHLLTIDFASFVEEVRSADWEAARHRIIDGAEALRRSGADFVVVTSNTGSSLAREVAQQISLPVLDITGSLYQAACERGVKRLGLLSTVRTCASGLFQADGKLHGVEVVAPSTAVADDIEDLIFSQLVHGEVTPAAFERVGRAIDWFAANGADAVAFACTDLTHLVGGLEHKTSLPVLDTTLLHARAAAQVALGLAKL